MSDSTPVGIAWFATADNALPIIFFLQVTLVSYLYWRVGHGIYWKVLLAMSIAGFIATNMETLFSLLTNKEYNVLSTSSARWLIVLDEPLWWISEYGIVVLNMLKMNAVLPRNQFRVFLVLQCVLFLGFVAGRIYVAYERYDTQILFSTKIWAAHTPAYAAVALSELLCTIGILYTVRIQILKEKSASLYSGMQKHLLKSSFFMLLVVDTVGVILTIATSIQSTLLSKILSPFLNIKSAFALIIAIDSCVMKIVAEAGSSKPGPASTDDRNTTRKYTERGGKVPPKKANYNDHDDFVSESTFELDAYGNRPIQFANVDKPLSSVSGFVAPVISQAPMPPAKYSAEPPFSNGLQMRSYDEARMDILRHTSSSGGGASALGGTSSRKSSIQHLQVHSPSFAHSTGAALYLQQSPASPSYPLSYSRGH